jgi:hypothetical protein
MLNEMLSERWIIYPIIVGIILLLLVVVGPCCADKYSLVRPQREAAHEIIEALHTEFDKDPQTSALFNHSKSSIQIVVADHDFLEACKRASHALAQFEASKKNQGKVLAIDAMCRNENIVKFRRRGLKMRVFVVERN